MSMASDVINPEDVHAPEEPTQSQKAVKPSRPNASTTLHTNTLRQPPWTYFHLSLFTTAPGQPSLDAISARQNLNSAMTRFLGLTGSSIPLDILQLEGQELWVRVPRDNSRAFHEAVSAWIGGGQARFVVKGRDDWLMKLAAGSGCQLFD
jgi:ribonuclease P/MRP protein subunit POP8